MKNAPFVFPFVLRAPLLILSGVIVHILCVWSFSRSSRLGLLSCAASTSCLPGNSAIPGFLFLRTVQHWWLPCFRGALEGTRCIWKTLFGGKKAAENQPNLIFTPHRELVKNSFERKTFYKTTLHVLKACLCLLLCLQLSRKKNEWMNEWNNEISIYTYTYICRQCSILNIWLNSWVELIQRHSRFGWSDCCPAVNGIFV